MWLCTKCHIVNNNTEKHCKQCNAKKTPELAELEVQKKGKENFFRLAILIDKNITQLFIKLIELYLANENSSFYEFINLHQHEIYHAYFNSKPCSRCSPDFRLPVRRSLNKHHLNKLFVSNYHRLIQNPDKTESKHCNLVKERIKTDVLDVFLAKFLLLNFCRSLFWYSCIKYKDQTLEKFLDDNKHEMFHLWRSDIFCCMCSYAVHNFPSDIQCFEEKDWNLLFNSKKHPCSMHVGTETSHTFVCAVGASANIQPSDISDELQETILKTSCPLRKMVNKLEVCVNSVCSHANDESVNEINYQHYWSDIEKCILYISQVCNCEEQEKIKLLNVNKRPFKPLECSQYRSKLIDLLDQQRELDKYEEENLASHDREDSKHTVTAISSHDVEAMNFCKIEKIVNIIGTAAVRKMFDSHFPPQNLKVTFRKYELLLRKLGDTKEITIDELNSIFTNSRSTSSNEFGISLMICLLKHLADIPIRPEVFSRQSCQLPSKQDTTTASDLERIMFYSNMIAGRNDKSMPTHEFSYIEDDLKGMFVLDDYDQEKSKQENVILVSDKNRRCDVCSCVAMGFCNICEQMFCLSCKKMHLIISATKDHNIIDLQLLQATKLPNIKSSCDNHNNKYSLFCSTHGVPFCSGCFSNHKNCTICKLEYISKSVKSSNRFVDLQTFNCDLLQSISSICKEVEDEVHSIPEKRKQFQQDVQECKKKMKNMFHELEDRVEKDIRRHEEKMKAVLKQITVCCENAARVDQDMTTLKEYASDLQTFLAMNDIESRVRRSVYSFIQIFDDTNVCTINPKCTPNVDKLISAFVDLKQNPIEVPAILNNPQVSTISSDIKSYELKKLITIEIPKQSSENDIQIRGCVILPNGQFCFTDRDNNRITLHDASGKFISGRTLPSSPVGIINIKGSRVAVSLSETKSILILNTDNNESEELNFKESPGRFGGLSTYDEEHIFVRVSGFGYYIITSKGEIIRKIQVKGSYMPYVAYENNRIYYTKWDLLKVFCCDMEGETIWEFSTDKLKPPNGVTTDEYGNVFVTGSYSNTIVVISANGKEHKELLSSDTRIENPIAISYDKKTKRVLVTYGNRCAILYSLKRG